MSDPLFGPEVRGLLQDDDDVGLKAFCESLHPAEVASALEDLEPEAIWRVLRQTNIPNQAAIFEYFPIEFQVEMVEGTGRQHIAKLIEEMSSDDRADLLRRLMPRVAEGLLRLVDEADRRDIAQLINYGENTAGALMTTDYAWVPAHISVSEAIDRLRLQAPDKETIYYIFVLDESRKLLGVVSLRELILAPRYQHIRDLMEDGPIKVNVNDDREHVAQELARYDLLAIPVVDDENRLVGIVTHDDIIDVVVEEATEDLHRQAAIGTMGENYLETGFLTVWRKRVGWLSLLFVAGLFTIFALNSFQSTLQQAVVLSLFIPLCIGTGGNSGSQAATLITRAMALNEITLQDWWRVLRHELLMGIALGASLGCLGFLICWVLPTSTIGTQVQWWQLAFIVAKAVMVICLWGTVVGSMLPIVFRALGFDPAFASSPFVAMFVDVTGIVIYFNVALLWLPELAGKT